MTTEKEKAYLVMEAARVVSDEARAACANRTGSYEALVMAGRAEMAATRAWIATWCPGACVSLSGPEGGDV